MAEIRDAVAKTEDRAFIEAVSQFVGPSGLGTAITFVRSGSATRTERARDALLSGATPLFSNSGATIEGLNVYEADRYNSAMLWDYYNGVLLPYLDRLPSETPEEFARRPGKVAVNYFRLLVGILAQLYSNNPGRRFYGENGVALTGPAIDQVTKAYRQAGANTAMGTGEEYRHMFGHALVRPLFLDGRWRLAVHPKPDYDLLVTSEGGENVIGAVVIREVEQFASGAANAPVWRLRRVWHVWTAQHYGMFSDKDEPVIEVNRYGRIPYAYMPYDENYATRFRQRDMAPEALLNSEFNEQLSLMNYHFRFATNQLTVVTDDVNNLEENLVMKPGQVLTLTSAPEGGKSAQLFFAVPQDRIASGKVHLGTTLEQLFRPWGINFTISEGIKSGVSGLAVEVSMAPVLTHLARRAENNKQAELELYGLWKTVAAADASQSWPEVAEVDVTYVYGDSFRSRQERREDTRFELDAGLIDRGQALFDRHPERFSTVEEARAALPSVDEVMLSRGSRIEGFSGNGMRINRDSQDRREADSAVQNMGGGEGENNE